jgi:hypothetical protein
MLRSRPKQTSKVKNGKRNEFAITTFLVDSVRGGLIFSVRSTKIRESLFPDPRTDPGQFASHR